MSSAANTRGLIEALLRSTSQKPKFLSSAANTRGLIEASVGICSTDRRIPSSAANTRGLIEARPGREPWCYAPARLPRRIPAASLKLRDAEKDPGTDDQSSAANTRGLIEAWR